MISTVKHGTILQNNQIILLLLTGTAMVMTDCHKICVFYFENKHVDLLLYCCDGRAFYFRVLYLSKFSFGKIE